METHTIEKIPRYFWTTVTATLAILATIVGFFMMRFFGQFDTTRTATQEYQVQIATLNVQLDNLNKNIVALAEQIKPIGTLQTDVKLLQGTVDQLKTTNQQCAAQAAATK